MPEQLGLDLRAYLRAIRKNWRLVLLITMACAALATFLTYQTKPTYSSTVTFFVTTPNTGSDSPLSGDQFGQQRVNSYVKLVPSERLATMVVKKSGTSLSPRAVMKRVSADADINTVLLTAHVNDESPKRSLALAKAISTEMVSLVDQLESQGGKKASPVALDVVSGPTLKPYPVAPQKKKDIATGLGLGLILGFAAAILRDFLDNTVRSTDTLRTVTRHPVLGSIGFDRDAEAKPLIVNRQAGSKRAEAFRQLRTALQFVNVDEPVKVIVVTSSTAAEGKSLTSANLALAFAEAGSRVLLIEADLRRPKVCDYLGLDRSIGLSNVLAGQAKLDDACQEFGRNNLMVLASGSVPPNPSELLGSRNMVDLLAQAREDCDFVIIDTPPLLPVTDAAVVAAHADGALLVVRHGKTKRSHVQQSLRALEAVGASVLGSVITMTPEQRRADPGGYEGYGYYTTEGEDNAENRSGRKLFSRKGKAGDATDDAEVDPDETRSTGPKVSLSDVEDETMEMPIAASVPKGSRQLPTASSSSSGSSSKPSTTSSATPPAKASTDAASPSDTTSDTPSTRRDKTKTRRS